MVEDTSNLMTHSRQQIKLSIFFIRGTFFIRFTVFEILSVFWKLAAKKYACHSFHNNIGLKLFFGPRNPPKQVSRFNKQNCLTCHENWGYSLVSYVQNRNRGCIFCGSNERYNARSPIREGRPETNFFWKKAAKNNRNKTILKIRLDQEVLH